MGKSVKIFIKAVSIFICLFFAANFFSACASGKDTDSTYAVTGYVFDELGKAVEGVSITSDFGTTETDENGKYKIEGLDGSLVLTASKEGYHFEKASKYITSSDDDANFVAYEEYVLTGVAHNNEVAVPNASVLVSSLAGDFYTTTDENGKFIISGVAGETEVSCEIDSLQFYKTTANIENPEVKINTTSSLTIKLEEENNKQIDYSKIELWVNGNKVYLASNEKVLKNISCGSVIELVSDYYNFNESNRFVVDSLNQVEDFCLSKIYSISGNVMSGSVPLVGASVYVDGKLAASADNTGFYNIPNLWSNRAITIEYSGFNFASQVSNLENMTLNFNGLKNISFEFVCDFGAETDLAFQNKKFEKLSNSSYLVKDVSLGDAINVSSSAYHLKKTGYVVGTENDYLVEGELLYDATVSGIDGLNATLLLDGNAVLAEKLQKLHGVHEVSAELDGYVFTTDTVDAKNVEATLTYKIPYDIVVNVASGNIKLAGAIVELAGNELVADANGSVVLEDVVIGQEFKVSANGYNSVDLAVLENAPINANLTYNISGYVKTGTIAVYQATIKVGESEVLSNTKGYFEFENLSGERTVSVSKENFNFDSQTVSIQDELLFNGTYSISGQLLSEELDISTFDIYLRSVTNGETQTISSQTGEYSFENLTGQYILYVVSENGATGLLKPNSYTIADAGVYNFSSSGFKVSGYVKSGTNAIEGVKVTAGASSTYTNASGYYVFELLTSSCNITVEKQGYTFASNGIFVEEDTENVDFNGTYTVSGKITLAGKPLAGVKVYVNAETETSIETNADGEYSISGLSSTNTLRFEKAGYSFEETVNVSAAGVVEYLESSIKLAASVKVMTGNLVVTGYDYYINGIKIGTATTNVVEIGVTSGDIITFEKTGYVISSVVVVEPKAYTATATYTISGVVVSGTESITGFEVYLGGSKINATIDENRFAISGIEGETLITVKKAGLSFEQINVSGYQTNISLNGTYTVSGTVFVGSKVLSGVSVSLASSTVLTDSNGKFEFRNVSGKFNLTCQKEGYTFASVENKFGEQKLTIEAYYSVSGVVKSGSLAIAGASVSLVQQGTLVEYVATTDTNGEFTITGVSGVTDLYITKDGYSAVSVAGFNDISLNTTYNMTYSITINFTNETGVTVTVNGKATTVAGSTYKISGLSGACTIAVSKPNRVFEPYSIINADGPRTYSLTSMKAYAAHGYVTATVSNTSIPLQGVKISTQNNLVAYTDENGYYEFPAVAGDIYLIDDNITKETKTVTNDGAYNFNVNQNEFAFWLYATAIKKLDSAKSVQIFGSGTVLGVAMGVSTTQNVYSIVKRDTKGNSIRQNLNYGSEMLDIDPKVSLVAVTINGKTYYELLRGGAIETKTKAKHSASNLQEIDAGTFASTYGSQPTAYSSYVVNKNTATLKGITYDTSKKTYKMEVSLNGSTQSGYQQQILKLAPDKTKFNGFTSINLTINFNKNGWISTVKAEDAYKINQMTDVTVNSTVTYTYHTNASNLAIDDISITDASGQRSTTALDNSLLKSEQTEIVESMSVLQKYDIVSNLIYGKGNI